MSYDTKAMKPGYGKTIDRPFDDVLPRVVHALEQEGFGILTRIDVKETLKEHLDVEFPPYVILGACIPGMAHKALTSTPEVGVLLPCNVVVRQIGLEKTQVDVINADMMAQMFPGSDLDEVANVVGKHLDQVLAVV